MVETQDRVVKHSQALRDMQRAMWLLSADFNHIVMRDIREANGDRSPALIADKDDYLVQFTRQGLRNPMLLRRSSLQRVAYSIGPEPVDPDDKDNKDDRAKRDKHARHLLRHVWGVVDRLDETEETIQVLVRDVDEVKLSFMDAKGDWKDDWPEKKMSDKEHIRLVPVAIKMEIRTEKDGTIERIFQTGNVVNIEKLGEEKQKP
jgi:general secretion pathway protein J